MATTTSFEAGTLAGAGSFRCAECDFAVALHAADAVPVCPSCGGTAFVRSSVFTDTGAMPVPVLEASEPGWLAEARAALVRAGDYVAFEHAERVNVVALQEGWTRIGRSLTAHVRLDDPTVSRRHALIHRDDGGAQLLDDRSLNGVFLNGQRVELADLADGDLISVGRFTLHVVRLAGNRHAPSFAGSTGA